MRDSRDGGGGEGREGEGGPLREEEEKKLFFLDMYIYFGTHRAPYMHNVDGYALYKNFVCN